MAMNRRTAIRAVINALRKQQASFYAYNRNANQSTMPDEFKNLLKSLQNLGKLIKQNVPPGPTRGAALAAQAAAVEAAEEAAAATEEAAAAKKNEKKAANNAASRQAARAEAQAARARQREAFTAARPIIGKALTAAQGVLEKASILGPKARMNRWYTNPNINAEYKNRSIQAYKIAAQLGNVTNQQVVAAMRAALNGTANQQKLLHKHLVYPLGLAAYPKSNRNYVAGLEQKFSAKKTVSKFTNQFVQNYGATRIPSAKRNIVNAYLNTGRNINANKRNTGARPANFWNDVNAVYAEKKAKFIPGTPFANNVNAATRSAAINTAAAAYRGNTNKNKTMHQNANLKAFWAAVNARLNRARQLKNYTGTRNLTANNLGMFRTNKAGLEWALNKVGLTNNAKKKKILNLVQNAEAPAGGNGNGNGSARA